MMKLYTYFRSSAAFRVRIALNLKQLDCESLPISLKAGEHYTDDFKLINPQGLLPVLEDNGHYLTQSLAICEYLEECFPSPPLLPLAHIERARVRALAMSISCDIHPLNNLRVLKYLKDSFKHNEEDINTWYRHWIKEGFSSLETLLVTNHWTGQFCHGDTPGLADICLVPQVYNAKRYHCSLDAYPTISRIHDTCLQLPAFSDAWPEKQVDAT